MINVLVTGGNGQLALTIKQLFSSNKDATNFIFKTKAELDITKKEDLNLFFNSNQIHYCINCAAYTNVELAETNPEQAFQINSKAVQNLALACNATGVILIHISTDYVFDGNSSTPYIETDIPNPINAYGESKLEGEKFVSSILNSYFIIRASWLYSIYGHNFFKTVIKKIENKEAMNVVSTQIGTPTSCEELAKFIYFLIKTDNQQFGIYHFSPVGQTSWYGFAYYIANFFKSNAVNPVLSYETKAARPNFSVLNNDKIKHLNFELSKWEKSVDTTIKQYLSAKF
ncbi:dTDP-4-dehydrorhamnose reductase [Paucihalobacter sp.]|uniref:dTDP-4-dehydrorhamnose reductase n=1 Tax=Paucihalobacter sp. TaxID=2850405 RepID=UPI002FE2F1B2